MKNKKIFIPVIIVAILIIIGLVTGIINNERVKKGLEPKYTIKIVHGDGWKITYLGLGYKVTRYTSISPNEPFKNSFGSKLGSWFMKYTQEEAIKEYTRKHGIEDNNSIMLEVKEKTVTSKGATFILKNNTDDDYVYEPSYYLEKREDNNWNTIELEEPLSWTTILYNIKANEKIELNIDWSSTSYGELKSGTYRLVKNNFRKKNSSDSRGYTLYSEFNIK